MLNVFRATFVVFAVVFSFFAHAHEWGLQTRVSVLTPNTAPGLILGQLSVRIDHSEPAQLSNQRVKLEFKATDHKGSALGTWNYDLEASDEQCLRRGDDRCELTKIVLPVAALHYGCRGYLTLKQGNRSLGHESRFVLPHCGREYSNLSTIDMTAPTLIDAEEQLSVAVGVQGNRSVTKSFPVSAVILDQAGEILWAARQLVNEAVLPGVPLEISFTGNMSEKVRKLGCKVVLSSNGNGAIPESNLANNDASYEWGECLEVDQRNVDVIPFYNLNDRALSFGAKNIGDIDVDMPAMLFRSLDANGKILENLQFRLPGQKLEGFGDESTSQRTLAANVCAVVLEVDPNWLISNENRNNNQITFKLCK